MSKRTMTETENAICAAIQDDIPLETRPFEKLAKKIGISEDEFIKKANEFLEKGYIRRFGAAIRHRKAGIAANGMGVWIDRQPTPSQPSALPVFGLYGMLNTI